MNVAPGDDPLRVSQVRHRAEIEVDEEGTTAAAVTSPAYSSTSPIYRDSPLVVEFVANRPFLFAIVEYENGEVVFLGHVLDPSQGPW